VEILDENGGPADRLAVPDAVLETDEAVLGFLEIEAEAFVVDIPDFAVGGQDAPVLARDVRVERVEESFIAFETEGCGSCVSNICANICEVGPHLHGQLDLGAAPDALGGDLHRVEQTAQIFCAIVGRDCGHARLTWFFYTLRSVEADYLRVVRNMSGRV
jgi:hypothetical protein